MVKKRNLQNFYRIDDSRKGRILKNESERISEGKRLKNIYIYTHVCKLRCLKFNQSNQSRTTSIIEEERNTAMAALETSRRKEGGDALEVGIERRIGANHARPSRKLGCRCLGKPAVYPF